MAGLHQNTTLKEDNSTMLAKFVDKIVSLREAKTFEINGETYSTESLSRIAPHVDRPDAISVSGLNSICKLIREELDAMGAILMVEVNDYATVTVFTTLLNDFSRNKLYTAHADVPSFRSGFRNAEEAIIQIRSLFIPSDDTNYLLDLLSRINTENGVSTTDNGVTQTVTAKQGISLKETVQLKPRVTLQPFRTFLEVPQPESEFLLRINERGEIGLFEADGGVWKLEAKRNVAAYFEKELKDLIEEKRVVVMY